MTEARDVWGERRGLRGPLPPDVGEEFIEGVARMGGHAGQQVAQVGEGVEVMAAGAGDEAEVDGGGVTASVEYPPSRTSSRDGFIIADAREIRKMGFTGRILP